MTDPLTVSADSLKVVGTLLRFAPGRLDDRSWNALIGVVTAIVGNILISFALNLQRYAHIRLQKEQRQRSKPWNGASASAHKRPEYGAVPEVNGHGTRRNDRTDASPESQPLLNSATPQTRPLRTDSGLSRRTDSGLSARLATPYEDEDEQKSYLKSPYWWAGIFLMTIGEAGNFLAYGFAPASTVSPLGVVALISNCIIAPCLLHERYRQRDFWGVLVAIAGAVTIVMSAESNEAKMGPSEIWDAISRWEFELYLGITAAAIGVLAWASPRYGKKTLLIDLGLVGLFGEYTALSTKGIASLLSDTLWRVITFPITYLLVLVLVFTALMQIRYINRALQRFPSTQVIPTQFVLFTISVIIGSAVLYRDFESATPERMGQFVGGCLMTFLGVYLITRGRPPSQSDTTLSLRGSGERISLVDEESLRGAPAPATPRGVSIDGRTAKPLSGNHLLSGENSGRSAPHSPAPGISIASSVPESWAADDTPAPLESPWETTPTHFTPEARRSSYDMPEGHLSTSVPGRSTSWHPYMNEPRPQSLARKSMSRIFPNPIVTPLSSSLNGIVVESLRQGIDSPGRRALRSTHEAMSRSDSLPEVEFPSARATQDQEAAGPSELARVRALPPALEPGSADARKSRTKHITASLRSMLQPSRQRSRSQDDRTERGAARRHELRPHEI